MEHKVNIKLQEMMGRSKIRTIKELHEKTGISRTIISDLLNENKRKVRLDTIEKLCIGLNCEIGELIEIRK